MAKENRDKLTCGARSNMPNRVFHPVIDNLNSG
jgi:hypothetical protein